MLARSKISRAIRIHLPTAAILASFLPMLAFAGPPFATDDPVPLPYHTGEFYFFAAGAHAIDGTTLDAAPGIETNYSFFSNTFLHFVAPLKLDRPSGGRSAYSLGEIEMGFKWRLIEQSRRRPDIGAFPFLVFPAAEEVRDPGAHRVQILLPIWLQKDAGPWTTYGGGGYWINPGDGDRNWWFTGIVLQRQLSSRLYLGAELFHQTADAVDASPSTGFNVGGGLTIKKPYQILFSAGRNIQNYDANRFSFYTAFYRTF